MTDKYMRKITNNYIFKKLEFWKYSFFMKHC